MCLELQPKQVLLAQSVTPGTTRGMREGWTEVLFSWITPKTDTWLKKSFYESQLIDKIEIIVLR